MKKKDGGATPVHRAKEEFTALFQASACRYLQLTEKSGVHGCLRNYTEEPFHYVTIIVGFSLHLNFTTTPTIPSPG